MENTSSRGPRTGTTIPLASSFQLPPPLTPLVQVLDQEPRIPIPIPHPPTITQIPQICSPPKKKKKLNHTSISIPTKIDNCPSPFPIPLRVPVIPVPTKSNKPKTPKTPKDKKLKKSLSSPSPKDKLPKSSDRDCDRDLPEDTNRPKGLNKLTKKNPIPKKSKKSIGDGPASTTPTTPTPNPKTPKTKPSPKSPKTVVNVHVHGHCQSDLSISPPPPIVTITNKKKKLGLKQKQSSQSIPIPISSPNANELSNLSKVEQLAPVTLGNNSSILTSDEDEHDHDETDNVSVTNNNNHNYNNNKPKIRKLRKPTAEEDIVDGFAILGFKSYEELTRAIRLGEESPESRNNNTKLCVQLLRRSQDGSAIKNPKKIKPIDNSNINNHTNNTPNTPLQQLPNPIIPTPKLPKKFKKKRLLDLQGLTSRTTTTAPNTPCPIGIKIKGSPTTATPKTKIPKKLTKEKAKMVNNNHLSTNTPTTPTTTEREESTTSTSCSNSLNSTPPNNNLPDHQAPAPIPVTNIPSTHKRKQQRDKDKSSSSSKKSRPSSTTSTSTSSSSSSSSSSTSSTVDETIHSIISETNRRMSTASTISPPPPPGIQIGNETQNLITNNNNGDLKISSYGCSSLFATTRKDSSTKTLDNLHSTGESLSSRGRGGALSSSDLDSRTEQLPLSPGKTDCLNQTSSSSPLQTKEIIKKEESTPSPPNPPPDLQIESTKSAEELAVLVPTIHNINIVKSETSKDGDELVSPVSVEPAVAPLAPISVLPPQNSEEITTTLSLNGPVNLITNITTAGTNGFPITPEEEEPEPKPKKEVSEINKTGREEELEGSDNEKDQDGHSESTNPTNSNKRKKKKNKKLKKLKLEPQPPPTVTTTTTLPQQRPLFTPYANTGTTDTGSSSSPSPRSTSTTPIPPIAPAFGSIARLLETNPQEPSGSPKSGPIQRFYAYPGLGIGFSPSSPGKTSPSPRDIYSRTSSGHSTPQLHLSPHLSGKPWSGTSTPNQQRPTPPPGLGGPLELQPPTSSGMFALPLPLNHHHPHHLLPPSTSSSDSSQHQSMTRDLLESRFTISGGTGTSGFTNLNPLGSGGPNPQLFTTPPIFKDLVKVDSSPFYRNLNISAGIYPGFNGINLQASSSASTPPAVSLSSASSAPTPFTTPPNPLLPPFPTKKTGRWNAMHVRIAWEIYQHQQKNGNSTNPGSGSGGDVKLNGTNNSLSLKNSLSSSSLSLTTTSTSTSARSGTTVPPLPTHLFPGPSPFSSPGLHSSLLGSPHDVPRGPQQPQQFDPIFAAAAAAAHAHHQQQQQHQHAAAVAAAMRYTPGFSGLVGPPGFGGLSSLGSSLMGRDLSTLAASLVPGQDWQRLSRGPYGTIGGGNGGVSWTAGPPPTPPTGSLIPPVQLREPTGDLKSTSDILNNSRKHGTKDGETNSKRLSHHQHHESSAPPDSKLNNHSHHSHSRESSSPYHRDRSPLSRPPRRGTGSSSTPHENGGGNESTDSPRSDRSRSNDSQSHHSSPHPPPPAVQSINNNNNKPNSRTNHHHHSHRDNNRDRDKDGEESSSSSSAPPDKGTTPLIPPPFGLGISIPMSMSGQMPESKTTPTPPNLPLNNNSSKLYNQSSSSPSPWDGFPVGVGIYPNGPYGSSNNSSGGNSGLQQQPRAISSAGAAADSFRLSLLEREFSARMAASNFFRPSGPGGPNPNPGLMGGPSFMNMSLPLGPVGLNLNPLGPGNSSSTKNNSSHLGSLGMNHHHLNMNMNMNMNMGIGMNMSLPMGTSTLTHLANLHHVQLQQQAQQQGSSPHHNPNPTSQTSNGRKSSSSGTNSPK